MDTLYLENSFVKAQQNKSSSATMIKLIVGWLALTRY